LFSILPDKIKITVDPVHDQRENVIICRYQIPDYPLIQKLIYLFQHKLSSNKISVSDDMVRIKIPGFSIPYRIAEIQVEQIIITLKKE